MDNSNSVRAFTVSHSSVVRYLKTESKIVYNQNEINCTALWDTGASGSCVSAECAAALGMIPTGKKLVRTASGSRVVNTYLVSLVLPNDIEIRDIEVCSADIGSQKLDVLIGMDVITLGDFCVSNFSDKTVFTFRVPAKETIDFAN